MELKPRTRKEFLIADFIDKDTPDIVPKTRSKMFLKQMLDKISTSGSGSGGGGAFVVTFTNNDGDLSVDKTYGEIEAAIDSGLCVSAVYAVVFPNFTMNTNIPLCAWAKGLSISFAGYQVVASKNQVDYVVLAMSPDSTFAKEEFAVALKV